MSRLDVSGSGDITNRADNVFSVYRAPRQPKAIGPQDASITILKNRFSGKQDEEVPLVFTPECRRFYYDKSEVKAGWRYGWEKLAGDGWESMGREVEVRDDELPF